MDEPKVAHRISWLPRAHALSWMTLAVTTGAILITAVDGGILPAVLPSIQDEFDLNSAQAGWINTVFFLGLIAGALGFGWLSDRIGTGYRRTWTWNVAMATGILGGALTFGFAGSFVAFLLLRIPMGISRGGSEPVTLIALMLGVAGWREAFLLIPLRGVPIMVAQVFVGTARNQAKVYDWIDRNGYTRPPSCPPSAC